MKKKVAKTLIIALSMGLSAGIFAGCQKEAGTDSAVVTESEIEEYMEEYMEEEYTGDASLDDPLNQDEIGENELMVVSFGTSFNDNRRETIGAIEKAIADKYGDKWSVRRAFTAQIVINHINDRDGVKIDNVTEALDRAVENGVKRLVILPTHLMKGLEYEDLVDEVAGYAEYFDLVAIGDPLLYDEDGFTYDGIIDAITEDTKSYVNKDTAIVYMGHGTEADSNHVYADINDRLHERGFNNYFVGTVEAYPTLEDVIESVSKAGYSKVVLAPLMVVAGDHANNDMAGPEEDSWKSQFEAAGFEVETHMKGLGALPSIQDIYVNQAKKAIDQIQN